MQGGNTANMLAIWRVHGLDAVLRDAWEAGVVLAGGSAGANCWFEASTTDAFLMGRADPLPDGLGFVRGSFCPHYDSEPARQPAYRRLVADGVASRRGRVRRLARPRTWWEARSPSSWPPTTVSGAYRVASDGRGRLHPDSAGGSAAPGNDLVTSTVGGAVSLDDVVAVATARRSGSTTTRAPGWRRLGRWWTAPSRRVRRSTASPPGSGRSPTCGSTRRRPRSCSTGSCVRTPPPWGRPLSREEARAMLLLRAHVLALGHSGVRPAVVDLMVADAEPGRRCPAVPAAGVAGRVRRPRPAREPRAAADRPRRGAQPRGWHGARGARDGAGRVSTPLTPGGRRKGSRSSTARRACSRSASSRRDRAARWRGRPTWWPP